MDNKTTKLYSAPLMKQTCKANIFLAVIIVLVMCLMSTVINYAMSIIGTDSSAGMDEDVREDFFSYMYVLASYNTNADAAGQLSYDDFLKSDDKSGYEAAFNMYNAAVKGSAASDNSGKELSVGGFEAVSKAIEGSEVDADTYVSQFEYAYALADENGCFSGKPLQLDDLMDTMLAAAGISQKDLDKIQKMDMAAYFNKIYFTVIGLLPIFIFVIIAANSLIAAQVDKGSMAYILSTPTKRSAVVTTQAIYMILAPFVIIGVVCISRLISTQLIFGEVNIGRILMLYLGMYLVTEAAGGICYMCSCIFNQSKKAIAVGGGLTVWFFLASLLGMFGTEDMVNMGMGAEVLGVFNKLTIVSLFDADAVNTIGTAAVDMSFMPTLAVLAVIAIVCYVVGGIRFCKKDLPL